MPFASNRCSAFRVCITALLATIAVESSASSTDSLPFWHSSMSHKAWARPEGAPSAANAIVQDATGMLWFAAANGLYRFDGASFERVDDVAGNKLLSPNVQALAIFGDEFWLGYTFGGISVFKQGAVRHYGVADGLPSASINRVGKTADGTVWAATPSSTYWLNGARWQQVLPADGVPEGEQSGFSVLHDGTLLINHANGLYRSVPGTHRFRQVDGPEGVVSSQVNADGKVLLMRLSTTHYQFDPVTEIATPLRLPDAKAEYYSINRDRRNAWWIGLGDGMRMYTPEFKLKKFLPAPQTFSGVAGYVSPFDDREGNLWFMTENGVDRMRETRLTMPELPFRGMDFSLAAGDHGEVWISGNTTLYDMAPRAFAIAPDGQRIASTMPGATASTRSADGSLWFGNFKHLWQRRDGKVQQWPLPPAISGIDLQAMAMTDDGSLCVALLLGGVYLLYLRRLSYLTARAVERLRTRLEERERIARALHDTFLQSVQGLILRFHSIKAVLPRNDVAQQQIDAALDAADAVADEGRKQLMGLRVHHAGSGELASALAAAGAAAAAQCGVAFSLREDGARRALQAEAEDELFAIAREAIANALCHSGSAEVLVQLSYGAATFTLEVHDYGKGFDDEVLQAGQRDRRWGLPGMRERASNIGGQLAIHSKRGEGTTVVVKIRASLAYQ